ncbi:hypothetical protein IFM89_010744 [Coptis chinensis]|uniref:Topoisomerase I C-terminal domain-containing protein n=1 Tax=Coptis chinensis TaxID=261450 RepID=A0A835MAR5_9MAGN|nr:hypothetical protein IFM89_010744 [Coptis chinensis]
MVEDEIISGSLVSLYTLPGNTPYKYGFIKWLDTQFNQGHNMILERNNIGIDFKFHKVWGQLMKTGYQNSRFAHQFHKVWGQLMKTGYQNSRFAHQVICFSEAFLFKEDLKTVALDTSKINYLDPRISVAWCKRHEVPIEKVVFILPDSYIDPPNEEYGGDKYENRIITHRPPRSDYRFGRYGDRKRSNGYNKTGPPQRQNFAPSPAAPGDGRNYVAQQNYPLQQNFNSTPIGPGDGRGTGVQSNSIPQSYITQQNYGPVPVGQQTGGRETYQAEQREPMPSYQRTSHRREEEIICLQRIGISEAIVGTLVLLLEATSLQGASSSYSQSYPGPGKGQRFSQMEQRDGMQGGEQQNFNPPMGQMRNDQV